MTGVRGTLAVTVAVAAVALCLRRWPSVGATSEVDGLFPEVLQKLSGWSFRVDSVEVLNDSAQLRSPAPTAFVDDFPSVNWTRLPLVARLLPSLTVAAASASASLPLPWPSESVSAACVNDWLFFVRSLAQAIDANHQAEQTCVDDRGTSSPCPCAESVGQLLDSVSWTFSVLDAFGKPESGIFKGNLFMLGAFSECRKVVIPRNTSRLPWRSQYCRADFPIRTSVLPGLATTTAAASNGTKASNNTCSENLIVKWGLCVPDSCTEDDLRKIGSAALQFLGIDLPLCSPNIICHHDLDIISHPSAFYYIVFLIIVFSLIVYGTLYELFVFQPSVRRSIPTSGSFSAYAEAEREELGRQTAFGHVLLAFSLCANARRIFSTKTKPGQILCLHGVRVLSMFWIVLGHTYYWGITYMSNLLDGYQLPNDIMNQVLLNGSLSVDPFFYLSGMLLAYLWLKNASAHKDKLKSGGVWLQYYLHRYLRLTPVYMVVMFFDTDALRFFTDGPMWPQRGFEAEKCARSWWVNALYINNFVRDEECMTWTWFLANDMQFYVLAPLILVPLLYYTVVPIIIIIALILISGAIRSWIILSNDWPPIALFTVNKKQFEIVDAFWDKVYIKPYCRCSPFLIGILVGYALYKTKMQVKMPKLLAVFLWIVNTVVGLLVVFGLYNYSRTYEISYFWRVMYTAFGRTAFSVVVAWVTFACATGYGGPINTFLSWKFWIPLSRLVYTAYLIHPVFIRAYYASQNIPMHFSDHFQMVNYFFGNLMISFAIAFFVSAAFEMPVQYLEMASRGPPHKTPMASTVRQKRNAENVEVVQPLTASAVVLLNQGQLR